MQSTSPLDARLSRGRSRRDIRRRALIITVLATLLIGSLAGLDAPSAPVIATWRDVKFADLMPIQAHRPLSTREQNILHARFEQGVAMLRMRQYEFALTAFHEVLAIAPTLPEAHVNMGYALIGLEQWGAARDFFATAIDLRLEQLNAYYGLAIALEALGDLSGAIGAMESYLHRAPVADPYRQAAESALWEWREKDNARRKEQAPAGSDR